MIGTDTVQFFIVLLSLVGGVRLIVAGLRF